MTSRELRHEPKRLRAIGELLAELERRGCFIGPVVAAREAVQDRLLDEVGREPTTETERELARGLGFDESVEAMAAELRSLWQDRLDRCGGLEACQGLARLLPSNQKAFWWCLGRLSAALFDAEVREAQRALKGAKGVTEAVRWAQDVSAAYAQVAQALRRFTDDDPELLRVEMETRAWEENAERVVDAAVARLHRQRQRGPEPPRPPRSPEGGAG